MGSLIFLFQRTSKFIFDKQSNIIFTSETFRKICTARFSTSTNFALMLGSTWNQNLFEERGSHNFRPDNFVCTDGLRSTTRRSIALILRLKKNRGLNSYTRGRRGREARSRCLRSTEWRTAISLTVLPRLLHSFLMFFHAVFCARQRQPHGVILFTSEYRISHGASTAVSYSSRRNGNSFFTGRCVTDNARVILCSSSLPRWTPFKHVATFWKNRS